MILHVVKEAVTGCNICTRCARRLRYYIYIVCFPKHNYIDIITTKLKNKFQILPGFWHKVSESYDNYDSELS